MSDKKELENQETVSEEKAPKKKKTDDSMPGYTKSQKTTRRIIVWVMVIIFALGVFIPVIGYANKNREAKKNQPTTVATTLSSKETQEKEKKMNAMKIATLQKINVIFSGDLKNYEFTDVDTKSGAVMGKSDIQIKGKQGKFTLYCIYTPLGTGYTTDYLFLRGTMDGQKVQQLYLNDGTYNTFLKTQDLPTAQSGMKTE